MHGTALTQAHVGIYDHIGENFRFRADGRVMTYHTVCLHHGTCLDAHIGFYHHMSPNVGGCRDISRWIHHRAWVDTGINVLFVIKKLRSSREGQVGLSNDQARRRTVDRIFGTQDHSSSLS